MMNAFPPASDDQVTLGNWRTTPFNAWAFHHVREIVPSAEIRNDPGKVFALPDGTRVDMPAIEVDGDRIDYETYAARAHLDAMVVLHQGRVIHEDYRNGMDATSPHILMSVSKSMLGLVAGILAERGDLDIDALAETYVPELATTAFKGATVRQLLDMRTGVLFDEDYLATSGPIIEYRKSTNWDPLGEGEQPSDLRSFFQNLRETTGPHGGAFDYTSPCTDLMGWVIERATGRRYADVFSEVFWQPMGAETPAYITVDRIGAPRCAGGVCMTTRDLARVGQMLLEGGRGVVPSTWIEDIAKNGDPDAWQAGDMVDYFPDTPMHYRAFWYVMRDEGPMLIGVGIHGQSLLIDLSSGLVMAKHASHPDPTNSADKMMTLSLFNALRHELI